MSSWFNEAWHLLQLVMRLPADSPLFWIFLALGLLAATVVLSVVSGVLGDSNANGLNNLGVVLLASAAMVLAAAAVPVFLAPHAGALARSAGWQGAAAAVALAAVGAPIMAAWHRVRYFSALLAMVLAFAASVLVVLVLHVVHDAYNGGRTAVEGARPRRGGLEQTLGRPPAARPERARAAAGPAPVFRPPAPAPSGAAGA